jgi:predicted nuclease of predicted toxin-antitoxin system
VLADRNIEGQSLVLWGILAKEGWLDMVPARLATFKDLGLPFTATDAELWYFAQRGQMIILTDNRNMAGEHSLEQVIRERNTPDSMPVLTIGKTTRLDEKNYRERCAYRIVEILADLDDYLGSGRIFIP